ncbi:hypothetical protein FWG86_02045 [Candidatus Saccharibacteria bacterium]|nr:hypothetical protein [Candidatus Saccharibacteria bacterium]
MKKYNIITPTGMKPKPDVYEWAVAEIMAGYFKSNVSFVERSSKKSPDILIMRTHTHWETKNIRGNGKFTIQNNLREASSQSKHVVIGLSRTRMTTEQARSRTSFFLKKDPSKFKQVIIITKKKEVLEIK